MNETIELVTFGTPYTRLRSLRVLSSLSFFPPVPATTLLLRLIALQVSTVDADSTTIFNPLAHAFSVVRFASVVLCRCVPCIIHGIVCHSIEVSTFAFSVRLQLHFLYAQFATSRISLT